MWFGNHIHSFTSISILRVRVTSLNHEVDRSLRFVESGLNVNATDVHYHASLHDTLSDATKQSRSQTLVIEEASRSWFEYYQMYASVRTNNFEVSLSTRYCHILLRMLSSIFRVMSYYIQRLCKHIMFSFISCVSSYSVYYLVWLVNLRSDFTAGTDNDLCNSWGNIFQNLVDNPQIQSIKAKHISHTCDPLLLIFQYNYHPHRHYNKQGQAWEPVHAFIWVGSSN